MTSPQRFTGDRGATLPEYGLIIAFVVVVSLVAIDRLETASTSRLEDREGSSGATQEVSGSGFTYSTGSGSSGGGGSNPPPSTVVVDGVTAPSPVNGSKNTSTTWNATVDVTVSSGGQAVEGARADVTFDVGGTITVVTCPLPSNKKGEITCAYSGIPASLATVTMTVTSIYGANIDGSNAPQVTVQFDRPASVKP